MNTQKFADWTDHILDKYDEYAYRHIYDAYLTVKSNDRSLYYILEPEPLRNELKDKTSHETELEFDNADEKQDFLQYLFTRFCHTHFKSMQEWHATKIRLHGEDMSNWE